MSSSINKQIYLTKSCFEDLIPKRRIEIKMHLDSNFQRQNIDQRSKNIYIYIYIYTYRERYTYKWLISQLVLALAIIRGYVVSKICEIDVTLFDVA